MNEILASIPYLIAGTLFGWSIAIATAREPKCPRYAVRCVRTGHFAFHGKSFRTREKALQAAQKRIPAWAWAISPYELVEVQR